MSMCRKRNASPAGRSGTVRTDDLVSNQRREPARQRRIGPRTATGRGRDGRSKTRPTTDARSATARTSGASRSRRDAISAWIVGGVPIDSRSNGATWSSESPTSAPRWINMSRNSSTNRGLPSAASAILARTPGCRAPAGTIESTSSSATSWESGSRTIVVALLAPLPSGGRSSQELRSGRQIKRIRASRARSATDSSRSMRVGSAQWMSSIRTTRGRSSARCSRHAGTPRTARPGPRTPPAR